MQKFPIVYCDPNWDYAQRAPGKATKFGGGVNSHYQTDGIAVMRSWQRQFLAMRPGTLKRPEPGVMLMWVTGPYSEEAPKLMRAWGYTPVKPIFYWGKLYPNGGTFYGPGAYTGSNVEYILLGHANPRRMLPRVNRIEQGGDGEGIHELQLCAHPRDERGKIIHSKKPEIFRELIVKLFGDLPRVEVFARERALGWHAIGDQLPGGQLIQPGRVIPALEPPTAYEAGLRHRGTIVQPSLFGAVS
jgi:N6-adenosine-specific RNA methylase IME4